MLKGVFEYKRADIVPDSPRIEYFILIKVSSKGCGEFFIFHFVFIMEEVA